MASTEDKAYEIMRELDVNYVLVIFGGLTGYSSDGKILELIILKKYINSTVVTGFSHLMLFFTSQNCKRFHGIEIHEAIWGSKMGV